MFKPAKGEMIITGDFRNAKRKAEDCSKWLFVMVLDSSIFDSQMLIRDHLNDDEMLNIFEQSFIIYAIAHNSYMGKHLKDTYNISNLPLTGIIDPRTGKLKQRFDKKPNLAQDKLSIRSFIDYLPFPGYKKQLHDNQGQANNTSINQPGDDSKEILFVDSE